MIKYFKNLTLLSVLLMLTNFIPLVYAQQSMSMHDTLSAAIEKQSNEVLTQYNDKNDSYFSWLDGAPSISLMRLESQQALGTTESEISVNLPIKSPFLKQVEKSLVSKVDVLRKSAQQQYALYLSGLIRNLVWALEFEKASLNMLSQKQNILSALATQYEEMAAARAIPQYLLLIVQNELNQQDLLSIQNEQNIKNLRAQYSRLTGLRELPVDITELLLDAAQANMNSHPDIQALDAAYESTQQQLFSASKRNEPWNVQVTGRRVNTHDFSENQLGIGIEIPITIGQSLSSTQQSEYLKITNEYTIAKQKLLTQLNEAYIKLSQEYEFLLQKQKLLDNGLPILNSLSKAMDELREANAPNQEFYIRTLLNTIDSAQNIELNKIHVQRQIALIKQSAGITL